MNHNNFSESKDCALITNRIDKDNTVSVDLKTKERFRNGKPWTDEDDSWFDDKYDSGNKAAHTHAMFTGDNSIDEFESILN